MKALVTGATGLIGSHVVERLVARGDAVRALVRPTSDTAWLSARGVELATGDVLDPDSLPAALAGVDLVYHCAALVGEWGRAEDFRAVDVRGTEHVVDAAIHAGVRRFVHLSSAAVYGLWRLRGRSVSEAFPIAPRLWRWDYYGRAKQQAERAVFGAARSGGIEVCALRPTLVYGPRDRYILPRVVDLLRARRLRIIGSGDNPLHLVYAGDVADAALRAGTRRAAPDRVYHLDGRCEASQREFLEAVAALAREPGPGRSQPLALAYAIAFLREAWGHLTGRPDAPASTRYLVAVCGGGETHFDTSKAARDLGWQPRVSLREGLARTGEWYRAAAGPGGRRADQPPSPSVAAGTGSSRSSRKKAESSARPARPDLR